jgi:hypothetical protein
MITGVGAMVNAIVSRGDKVFLGLD